MTIGVLSTEIRITVDLYTGSENLRTYEGFIAGKGKIVPCRETAARSRTM